MLGTPLNKTLTTHGPALAALLLRVGFGGFMAINHGWPKLMGFAAHSAKFASFLPLPSPLSLSLTIFGELVCSPLIVVGLWTRAAAVPAFFTMLVAAFGAHRDDITGDGEHALLFALAFAAIALLGPGRWSIDARLHSGRTG